MAQPFDAHEPASSRGSRFPSSSSWRSARAPSPALARSTPFPPTECWPGARRAREPEQLTWFDRSGKKLGTLGERAKYFGLALSPDEKSVAVCRTDPVTNVHNRRDIWILDVARGTSRRLTFDPADDCGPAWSPDGSRIAFFSDRRGVREIYQKAANGSGDDELLLASKDQSATATSEDWSADGRFLVYNSPDAPRPQQRPLPAAHVSGRGAEADHLSRDRGPRAHGHDRSQRPVDRLSVRRVRGRGEIYVSELSPRGRAGPGKWQVSTGGGWSPGGGATARSFSTSPAPRSWPSRSSPTRRPSKRRPRRPLFDVPMPEQPDSTASTSRETASGSS